VIDHWASSREGLGEVFALVVRFDLRDEAAARAFDALVAETLPSIRDLEPDTLVYAVHEVVDAPLSRVFYEVYRSPEAHRAHEATEHTSRFLRDKDQYVTDVRVDFLSNPNGKAVSRFES